jgi:hypothetical protein
MLWGASRRLSKVAAATFNPSMSQFSRAGSTRSLIINGCEVIDLDSDEEEEEYPQYSQMCQASRTTVLSKGLIYGVKVGAEMMFLVS